MDKSQQNSLASLEAANARGLGIEIDLRDCNQQLVISHDAPDMENQNLASLSKLVGPIALNIKSDGLLKVNEMLIREILSKPGSFTFDGSIPEMLEYRRLGLPHALRISEYEQELPWESRYIWLDAFESDWWVRKKILTKLSENYFVIVVSPELHGRSAGEVWDEVFSEVQNGNNNVGICTDFPDEFLDTLK